MPKLENMWVVMLTIMGAMAMGQSMNLKAGNWGTSFEGENKETVTNLRFYFHDTLSGSNPSAVRVAQPVDKNKSNSYMTLFGQIMMADDPLTETADPKSKIVGRAQGLYGSSCKQEVGLLMAMSFSFEDGPYNGSTFALLGKNSAMNPLREMPVVGGTGLFRMARGYAIAQTNWFDPTTGDAIVAYNVTLVH